MKKLLDIVINLFFDTVVIFIGLSIITKFRENSYLYLALFGMLLGCIITYVSSRILE